MQKIRVYSYYNIFHHQSSTRSYAKAYTSNIHDQSTHLINATWKRSFHEARLISEIIFLPVSCLITTVLMAAWRSSKITTLEKQSLFFLRFFIGTGALGANRYPGVCPLTNAIPGADGTVPESTVDPYQESLRFDSIDWYELRLRAANESKLANMVTNIAKTIAKVAKLATNPSPKMMPTWFCCQNFAKLPLNRRYSLRDGIACE
ncbi:hypothetical protein TNCV_4904641 [Trichonephila clavipes]|uniref:Uncharacterized protein n=1 Tax=Trichonephila clavipes TaxID=2585209 RepID=A0A8X6V3E9_TRICX|nr:hypothetical protein TNCV_4904641 [Trichonephila clavipes]